MIKQVNSLIKKVREFFFGKTVQVFKVNIPHDFDKSQPFSHYDRDTKKTVIYTAYLIEMLKKDSLKTHGHCECICHPWNWKAGVSGYCGCEKELKK